MPSATRPGSNICSDAIEAMTSLMDRTGQVPSLAELAKSMSVGEDALRRIFRDEDHLLMVVAENAMILLHDECTRAVVAADAGDPIAQFSALADAYVEWSHNNPREFRFIGSMPAGQFEGNETLTRYEQSIHEVMLRMLARAQSAGAIPEDEDLQLLVAIAHTYAYGVASKMLLGDLARWTPGLSDRDAARAILHGLIERVLR